MKNKRDHKARIKEKEKRVSKFIYLKYFKDLAKDRQLYTYANDKMMDHVDKAVAKLNNKCNCRIEGTKGKTKEKTKGKRKKQKQKKKERIYYE